MNSISMLVLTLFLVLGNLFNSSCAGLFSSISIPMIRNTSLNEEAYLMEEILAKWKKSELFTNYEAVAISTGVSKSAEDIKFFLYNNASDWSMFQTLNYNDSDSLIQANWISGAPFKVLIHGFTQSQNTSFPGIIKDAYLERMSKGNDQYNIIVVDWGKLAYSVKDTMFPIYTTAVQNVQTTGVRVGELLAKLFDLGVISDPDQVHLIGFSLGSHLAGQAGDTFQNMRPEIGKLGRCTGLDPAGPLFYLNIPNFNGRGLTSNDAKHVDVIHTSWGSLGIAKDIGQADFHPNFGYLPIQTQPRCMRILNTRTGLQVCSHNLATVIYAMTILRNIQACKCRSIYEYKTECHNQCKVQMKGVNFGEDWDLLSEGNYFLDVPKRSRNRPEKPNN